GEVLDAAGDLALPQVRLDGGGAVGLDARAPEGVVDLHLLERQGRQMGGLGSRHRRRGEKDNPAESLCGFHRPAPLAFVSMGCSGNLSNRSNRLTSLTGSELPGASRSFW